MRTYSTDVLVIGGGGAATAATLSAHEAGARTMLAVKGQFGVPGKRGAGATSNPLADFWTIRTVGKKGGWFNPPEQVHRDMLQTGLGMADPALCQIFVDEVPDSLRRLEGMGMKFGSKMLATMPAHEKAGTNFIVGVQKAIIEATQTQVLEHANLVDLWIENGRCVGAIGIDDEAEPFVISAGAVVLATGGVGQLFQYSFNPSGNTGDGYAMALRAGAEVYNMEFIQQGLATTWPTQAMVMLYEMAEPYRLLNAHGKTFVENYLPNGVTLDQVSKDKAYHWPVSCRDSAIHLDRALKGEVLAGRATPSNGVFLDLSRAKRGFQPEVFIEYMHKVGIDVSRDLLQVQIHHHTQNGGVRITPDTQTKIPGLFACGETMGYQGADRLGGTMLGGSQVFGWRAGKSAALAAKNGPAEGQPQDLVDERILAPKARFLAARGGETIAALKPRLQHEMWKQLLVEKNAESLAAAQNFIDDERDRLENRLAVVQPFDLVLAFEHQNLLQVAELIVTAARTRTESRGSHYRSDYPARNDAEWLTNIFLRLDKGKLVSEKRWVGEGWQDQPGDVRIKPWG